MSDNDFGFEDDIRPVADDGSDLSKVSELLLDNRFRRRKSNISQRELTVLATLDTIGYRYEIQFLEDWIPYYLEYKTSVDGMARKQITDIAQASLNKQNERWDDIMGMMGKR